MKDNDEVSLVDIFATCIKHRYFILFASLVCSLMIALWLFIAPSNNEVVEEKYNVNYKISSVVMPSVVLKYLPANNSVISISKKEMSSLESIAKANRFSYVLGGKELEGVDYNEFINSSKNALKLRFGNIDLDREFSISAEIKKDDFDLFDNFVNNLVNSANVYLTDYLNGLFEYIGYSDHPELMSLKKSTSEYVYISDEPFVTKVPVKIVTTKQKLKIVGISFIVALVCFILLVLAYESFCKFKKDTQSVEKIKAAWKAGKLKR